MTVSFFEWVQNLQNFRCSVMAMMKVSRALTLAVTCHYSHRCMTCQCIAVLHGKMQGWI